MNRMASQITALREIKLLKMLPHANILTLEEMEMERNKGEVRKKSHGDAVYGS